MCSRCCGCPSCGPGLPSSGALSLTSSCQVGISVPRGFWLLLESPLLPGQQANRQRNGAPGSHFQQKLDGLWDRSSPGSSPWGGRSQSFPVRGRLQSSTGGTCLMMPFIGSIPFLVFSFVSTKNICTPMFVSAPAPGRIQTKMAHGPPLTCLSQAYKCEVWAWRDHSVSCTVVKNLTHYSQMNEVLMIPIQKGFERQSPLSRVPN